MATDSRFEGEFASLTPDVDDLMVGLPTDHKTLVGVREEYAAAAKGSSSSTAREAGTRRSKDVKKKPRTKKASNR
jgi:hypothetical protein